MSHEVSPFLRRDEPRYKREERQETYAERIIPTHERQRGLIETYRYNWYVRTGSLWGIAQRLGDWGRKLFPFIGRGGWNGFGGRGGGQL